MAILVATSSQGQGRYFIVGCARSGTTLLQAMLASHPEVFSFPESHFFCEAAPRGRVRRRLGVVRKPLARKAMRYLLQVLNRPDLDYLVPGRSPMFRNYAHAFARAVGIAADEAGKSHWVEKTPHHLDFIPLISRLVNGAKFIHVLRDGRDVVASQFHALQQDPDYWSHWTVDQMVHQWNIDVEKSLRYGNSERHLLVSYERLITSPKETLGSIACFMGIKFDGAMLRHWQSTDRILGSRRSEPWMGTAFKPVEDRRGKKFNSLFSAKEQQSIRSRLLWGGDVGSQFLPAVA